jgi:hypothetical protein
MNTRSLGAKTLGARPGFWRDFLNVALRLLALEQGQVQLIFLAEVHGDEGVQAIQQFLQQRHV